MRKSPYIKHTDRLSKVIAAIQVMATYKFYKLDFSDWADHISGDESQAKTWESIFREHPEFFRLDQGRNRASLVWRRSYPKTYNVDTEKIITPEQFKQLSAEEKMRISRNPLKNEAISTLIDTAINLHTRALQHKQENRWWVPVVIGLLGLIIGLFIKS